MMRFISYVLILISISFLPGNCYAQDGEDSDPLRYSIIDNDPLGYKNVSIQILPLMLDLEERNPNIKAGINVNYLIKSRVGIQAGYSMAYLDRINDTDFNPYMLHGVPENPCGPARDLETNLTIYPIRRIIDRDHRVVLFSKNSYRTTTNYYINVPAKMIVAYGVRLGYTASKSFIKNENLTFEGTGLEYPADITLQGNQFATIQQMGVINVGLSLIKIRNLVVGTEKYGVKKVREMNEFYADLLVANSVNLDNMYVPVSVSWYDGKPGDYYLFDVNKNTIKDQVGFRLGYCTRGPSLLNAGLEIGKLTGVKSTLATSIYFQMKLALNIAFKL